MAGRQIAIVEDEEGLRENYAAVLRRQGYRVNTLTNRANAMRAFQNQLPDLVLLDIGLEDETEGGYDLCRELRHISPGLPIIFLTARDSDLDTISGLRLGADDYLTKDISLPHLLARIAALFRRVDALKESTDATDIQTCGDLSIDLNRMTAHWLGQNLNLTLTEFWILHAIVKRPGHVKNRDQLMQEASIVVDDTTITSHIKRIRKKIAQNDPDFACIETVYGMGYRWTCDK
ncbi:MAG: proteobacterial dedicated sortase system response regulator [Gammaproteobacteria bacterium]|nr:proteobacterial dedicated sortase system response regulator [Gammaproteobacteria bacterium]